MFLLLSLPPRVSAMSSDGNPLQFLSLVLKFVGFISIITILYMSEVKSMTPIYLSDFSVVPHLVRFTEKQTCSELT